MHAEQQLFNAHEVSRITGRSLASVWRDARAGRLEKVRIGGSTKFTTLAVGDNVLVTGGGPIGQLVALCALTAENNSGWEKASRNAP